MISSPRVHGWKSWEDHSFQYLRLFHEDILHYMYPTRWTTNEASETAFVDHKRTGCPSTTVDNISNGVQQAMSEATKVELAKAYLKLTIIDRVCLERSRGSS